MNILWITPQLPCRRTGGQVRQFYLIRELAKRHQLAIISFIRREEADELLALETLGVKIDTLPFTPPPRRKGWGNRLESWSRVVFDPKPQYAQVYPIERLHPLLQRAQSGSGWDVYQFEFLYSAPLSTSLGGAPWSLTAHNVESVNAVSQAKQVRKATHRFLAWREAEKLARWESRWIRSSNVCLVVSELDANRLRQLVPKKNCVVIPNGVDARYFKPPSDNQRYNHQIVFFGNFAYPPNVTGLTWFMENVYPILNSKFPSLVIQIVGANAPDEIKSMADHPGVMVADFVDDIRPVLWGAEICIVPLFSGGGTRLKILEAMAAGCPVVSTTFGAEGLDITEGVEFLAADDATRFAEKVVELIIGDDIRKRITRNAMKTVELRYDWEVIVPKLEEAYDRLQSEKVQVDI